MKLAAARHGPFFAACGIGAAAFAVFLWVAPRMAWAIAANAAFLVYLSLTLATLPKMSADWLSRHAASGDVPVWIIFLVTLLATAQSVALLFGTINATTAAPPLEFALALSAVALGWLTIHLMAAIHYAHEYWQPETPDGNGSGAEVGGLAFPGTKRPRGTDFVYFAFVVGMTAQTSDVDVTASRMRGTVVIHGIVSFFFNAVIVAAAVNIAVAAGH